MAIKDDLQNLKGLLETMNSEMETVNEMVNTTITLSYNLDIGVKDILNDMTKEDIDNFISIISADPEKMSFDNNTHKCLHDLIYDPLIDLWDEESGVTLYEYISSVLHEIKDTLIEYNELEKNKMQIEKEIDNVSENWFNYVNSDEYKNKKLARIEDMRQKAENETDPLKKKKILKMLSDMELSESLEFLFTRIEKYGKQEIEKIKESYFNSNQSQVIIKKFKSRLPRYGYNKDIYKMFFNLEEKFLSEEFHDLNNIFLFHVMRFISYTDTYNKTDTLFVSSILIKLYNLLYHKYGSDEQEKEFISVIEKFDSYFMDYIDEFTQNNITSPNHPVRKKRDKEYDEKLRLMFITSLQNEGIEPDTNLSTEELRNMLNEVIKKKEKEIENKINEEANNKDDAEEIIEIIDESTVDDENVEEKINEVTSNSSMKVGIDETENIYESMMDIINGLYEYWKNENLDKPEFLRYRRDLEPGFYPSIHEPDLRKGDIWFDKDNNVVVCINPSTHSFVGNIRVNMDKIYYMDKYGCYYIEESEGIYRYYDNNGIPTGAEDENEVTILQLLSVNAVEKVTIKDVFVRGKDIIN